ncbi:MAG TPA: type IV-A pilus assembly ATPase PilB [Planctomycetota bacterium]|jgi:type IV pilus assembly protein PilB|nr:type IV-A pilus assembly ATPase PilB [Planctomycetota bacterium]OQC19475.1 MAG: Type II secretion system protein E [Planctomycetes bacterium ADurb.Bin069]HNR99699.1 type IV-A pilus assembly ATPase PilB [Planctomycetota bacterium]HNU25318.1 type IV-A pilus assembly ATPase PilB [Planctomycetota bacterium]HOE29413.1 type IV-A pilus assembly ATPase PilB [Planctomycetota bacterium]
MARAITTFDKRLRSILLRTNILTEEDLSAATEYSIQKNMPLSQAVVACDHIKEPELLALLARETRLPPIDVRKIAPDDAVKEILNENVAKYYTVVPVSKIGDVLTLAVANPFDILKLDDLKIVTGCAIRPVVSTEGMIADAIERVYRQSEKLVQDLIENMDDSEIEVKGDQDEDDAAGGEHKDAEKSPVIKLVRLLITQAIRDRVSDIHIEPYEREVKVRYRVDGVLREVMTPPRKMHNAVISRIKIMSGLDIAERRVPQDGKFKMKPEGRQVDFRVSILPTVHGEKAVLRILDSSNLSLSLDTLGFEEKALKDVRKAISTPYGMFLVTGPTGSGKSTTLYSSINEVLCPEDNIVTVEDPVEYQLQGVVQVPVNVKRGLTFAAALRSILRQDPDTIMIGEIRDLETAEIAVKAALTGHLVFSTLHTNDAPSTITRLVDMGIDRFLVASSVVCVVAQRLGRRLCNECKRLMDPPPPKERLLEVGFVEEDLKDAQIYEAVGCSRCKGGYAGRFAILESMPISEAVRRIIIAGGSAIDIKDQAMKEQMISLRRCGLLNVLRGKTSIEEVLRSTTGD